MKETMKNLILAFVGESQARNRYRIYAKIAKREGYELISEVFLATAENEYEHAKSFFDMFNQLKTASGEKIETVKLENVDASVRFGDTIENLKAAIQGEHEENSFLYPKFAQIAEEEGFGAIAKRIRAIAKAEEHHEKRFTNILSELEKDTLYRKESKVYWVCMECGYIHEGKEPPEICPSCLHSKAFFKLENEEF